MSVKFNYASQMGPSQNTAYDTFQPKILYQANLTSATSDMTLGTSARLITDSDNVRCIELNLGAGYQATSVIRLPDTVKGRWIQFSAYIKGVNATSSGWLQLNYTSGSTQLVTNLGPVSGTYDWLERKHYRYGELYIPAGATLPRIDMGVNPGSGSIRITNIKIEQAFPPNPQIVSSASPPSLYGQRYAGFNMLEYNYGLLERTKKYNFNLIRFEICPVWVNDEIPLVSATLTSCSATQSEYDSWFYKKIVELDKMLVFARQRNAKIIIDYHFPIKGMSNLEEMTADPTLLKTFYDKWHFIASRYANNDAVYAFDCINEPLQEYVPSFIRPGSLQLQEEVCKIIRQYDSVTPISVEFDIRSGSDGTFSAQQFNKLTNYGNIVYQIHLYPPTWYQSQSYGTSSFNYSVTDLGGGVIFDKEYLRRYLQNVRNFQLAYRVPIIVGEFGTPRWIPNSGLWHRDMIELFEEYNWDWCVHSMTTQAGQMFNIESPDTPSTAPLNFTTTNRSIAVQNGLSAIGLSYTSAHQYPIAPTVQINRYANDTATIEITQPAISASHFKVAYKVNNGTETSLVLSGSSLSADYSFRHRISGTTSGDSISATVELYNGYGSAKTEIVKQLSNDGFYNSYISATPSRAYGLRKMFGTYNGPLMRLERQSDLSAIDISATASGELDIASVSAFVGAGTARIRTMYDQSGNGKHLTQTTSGSQIVFVSAGNIPTINGKYYFGFNGTSNYYGDTSPSMFAASGCTVSMIGLCPVSPSAAGMFITESGATSYYCPFAKNNTATGIRFTIKNDAATTRIHNTQISAMDGKLRQYNIVDNTLRIKIPENTDDIGSNTGFGRPPQPVTLSYFGLGGLRRSGIDNYCQMNLLEIVIYDSFLDRDMWDKLRIIQTERYM